MFAVRKHSKTSEQKVPSSRLGNNLFVFSASGDWMTVISCLRVVTLTLTPPSNGAALSQTFEFPEGQLMLQSASRETSARVEQNDN